MNCDFALERKLWQENRQLHRIFSSDVICLIKRLPKYLNNFPEFTDHTTLHSLNILDICNKLVGDNIRMLNADEIFILLTGIYLHDTGMGISSQDLEKYSSELHQVSEYLSQHPDADEAAVIRTFHHEFSGIFIKKNAMLFDFPSDKHLFCIVQVARGHRVTDLFDENEYPKEVLLDNGNTVRLPYLAALIRLADELDIAKDRNSHILRELIDLKTEKDIIEWKKHEAVESVTFEPDCIRIDVNCDDGIICEQLSRLFEKLSCTMNECIRVIRERTPFDISQNKIEINGSVRKDFSV